MLWISYVNRKGSAGSIRTNGHKSLHLLALNHHCVSLQYLSIREQLVEAYLLSSAAIFVLPDFHSLTDAISLTSPRHPSQHIPSAVVPIGPEGHRRVCRVRPTDVVWAAPGRRGRAGCGEPRWPC